MASPRRGDTPVRTTAWRDNMSPEKFLEILGGFDPLAVHELPTHQGMSPNSWWFAVVQYLDRTGLQQYSPFWDLIAPEVPSEVLQVLQGST